VVKKELEKCPDLTTISKAIDAVFEDEYLDSDILVVRL